MKVIAPSVDVSWLISYLQDKGLSDEVIVTAANLPPSTHLTKLKKLKLLDYLKLFNQAAKLLDDDNLGINLSKSVKPEDFGYVGLAANHCTTLRDALISLHQFHALISQGFSLVFEESPTTSTLTYRHLLPTSENIRHDIEFTFSHIVQRFRQILGDDWRPLRVDFTHQQPEDTSKHNDEFGVAVCFFNQPKICMTFSTDCLGTRLTDTDPELQQHFRDKLQNLLTDVHREESLLANVRYYTALSHSSQHCGAELVAELLHMSRRSMTRHLKDLGTSFRQIKEDVTLELAKTALLNSHANIDAIALELGFSDATAFSRSFKKSTGLTPTEYREKALTPGAY